MTIPRDDQHRFLGQQHAPGVPQSGWPSLFEDGMTKVKRGVTSIEEVLRVTEADGLDPAAFSHHACEGGVA
jgi:hypothetical protein